MMPKQTTRTYEDLKMLQSLPLDVKIEKTRLRIREWFDYWNGDVYISFSGGKDSTVLKHIADQMGYEIPAVFVNTGLEYPETQTFVRDIKAGKYECFCNNVEIIRPEMQFDEVIKKYGYPVISKEVAHKIHDYNTAKRNGYKNSYALRQLEGTYVTKKGISAYDWRRWQYLTCAPFLISHKCCDVMKKAPAKRYEKTTKRKPIIGTMACESQIRKQAWMQRGCNAFDANRPTSQPLSFWTEQDILHYIKKNDVPISTAYGEIRVKQDRKKEVEGQINAIDYLGCYEPEDVLETTRCDRTGCMFCMFGCQIEKEPNRFQRMKHTHPKQYDYCMNQLGLKEVLDYIGVPYE